MPPRVSEQYVRRSDARGNFEFEAVVAAGTAQLVAASPDHFVCCVPVRLELPPGGQAREHAPPTDMTASEPGRADLPPLDAAALENQPVQIRLELVARPRVRGRLTAAGGTPLAHHTVTVECSESYLPGDQAPVGWATLSPGPDGEPGPALQVLGRRDAATQRVQVRCRARTDASGLLDVALPQHGEVRLSVFGGAAGCWLEEFTLRHGDGDRELGTRALRPPRAGHVTLQTPAGQVLSNLRVAVTCDDTFQTQLPGPECDGGFRTDAAGRLPLWALPHGLALRLWPHLRAGQAPRPLCPATDHLQDGDILVLQVSEDR